MKTYPFLFVGPTTLELLNLINNYSSYKKKILHTLQQEIKLSLNILVMDMLTNSQQKNLAK